MIEPIDNVDNSTYTLCFWANQSEVHIDYSRKVVKVIWHWNIDQPTASKILNFAADKIEDGTAVKILLDRRKLNKFETGARIWIKNEFLLKRCKVLVHLVEKLAVVRTNSVTANIFGNLLTKSIQMVFPRLYIKKFCDIENADQWLNIQ